MRVALVHDWLLTWRGGEKVLAALAEMFPQAPIYTLFHDPTLMPAEIEQHAISSSLLDRVPGLQRFHRQALPLLPWAVRSLRPHDVDLVISSSHCAAKAVPIPTGARHLSYVHAPLRYMWDRFDDYFGPGKSSLPVRLAARALRPAFRSWDVATSKTVDRFVANSHHVAAQIAERYRRVATVVTPPVELERFTETTGNSGGKPSSVEPYFLCMGALAPYKRIDLAIDAFRQLGLPLHIAGSGQQGEWLNSLPPNVKALGQVGDAELPELYRNARALIFPGVEDFGITPLEMQASGRPVIALNAGGARETVTSKTGVFFNDQTMDSLIDAVRRFEQWEKHFVPADAKAQAAKFSKAHFQSAMQSEIDVLMR